MIRSAEQAFGIKTYEESSNLLRVSYSCKEIIFVIMNKFVFIDLQGLELTCKRLYTLSKDAPMWLILQTQMVDLIASPQLNTIPLSPSCKDILRDALNTKRPEALFTKCIFYYDNIYTPRNYTEALAQVNLIKYNESKGIEITPELKIKIDLLHTELLILSVEFGFEGDEETEDIANQLIANILESASASEAEKAWATCLIGLLFYYSNDDLIIDEEAQTEQDIILLLQDVINNKQAKPEHKAIANLYQDLINHNTETNDSTDAAEEQSENEENLSEASDKVYEPKNILYYELLHENSLCPHLPEAYKAKCILSKALEDLQDDITEGDQNENDRLYKEFQKVIDSKLAFPKDKKIAMAYQAMMKPHGLVT